MLTKGKSQKVVWSILHEEEPVFFHTITPFPLQAIVFSKLSSWKFSSLPLAWGACQFIQEREMQFEKQRDISFSVLAKDIAHTLAIFPEKWSNFLHVHVKLISIYSVQFVSLFAQSIVFLPNKTATICGEQDRWHLGHVFHSPSKVFSSPSNSLPCWNS